MMRSNAIIFGLTSLVCSLMFHASLVGGAVYFGWVSPEPTTLPELDMTSIDLSFSETPDETTTPATPPPQPAIEPSPAPEPPQPVVEPTPTPEPPPPPVVEPTPTPEPPPPPVVEPTPTPKPPPPPPVVKPPKPLPQETPPPKPQPPSHATPPAPAPSQARVKVDKPPMPRRRIKPEYPKGARERGEEGNVTLELDISARGTVADVRVIASCGFAELEQAAIQTVKHARFEPARRGSAKVPSTARITLTFRLKD